MKKIVIIVLLVLVVVSLMFFIPEEEKKTAKVSEEGETVSVISADGDTVFYYSIEDFREWASDNWESLFDEAPSFGELREVDPNNFYRFDKGASMYSDMLAFSVNDYAAATTISFVVVMEIESGEMRISEKNRGGIDNLFWSPQGDYIAYLLHTARARGEHISVLNVEDMRLEFQLSGEDVERDMPQFEDLQWKEERLFFTSGEDRWSVDLQGEDLRSEESVLQGNLMMSNPGMKDDVWYLSYEEEGSPGLSVELFIDEETECEGDFCEELFSKDSSLAGERVEVKGSRDSDLFTVKEIR